jgi:hypothetical protein
MIQLITIDYKRFLKMTIYYKYFNDLLYIINIIGSHLIYIIIQPVII